jgi:hypothetical protein
VESFLGREENQIPKAKAREGKEKRKMHLRREA